MDNNRRPMITRAWTAVVVTAAIVMGPTGVAQAQAVLYGAANTGGPEGASTLYTIDPATGTATAVGPIGFNRCSGMDFHPTTGILYATCARSPDGGTHVLITIDLVTGTGTEVGPTGDAGLGIPFSISDISFRNSDQTLYAYIVPFNRAGTINITTGTVTALGASLSNSCCGNGLAFSPADELFHATEGPLNTLNQETGEANFVVTLSYLPCGTGGGLLRVNAMDFQPGTGILFGSVNQQILNQGTGPHCLVTIDTATGMVTLIGQTVAGLDALAWSSAAEVASHFECYKAKGKKVRETVKLEDRFGLKPRVRVREPEFFCNPVNKNDEGIKNSDSHLTCYEIRDGEDDPKRRVGVKNQFGEQTVKVEGAKLLCVSSEILSVIDGQDHDNDDADRGDRDDEKD